MSQEISRGLGWKDRFVVADWLQSPEAKRVLTEREVEALRWRFGLVDMCPHTLADTASRMAISRERVRQLCDRALRKRERLLRRGKRAEDVGR